MPPKKKINKEDILKTAFQLVKKSGIESLNARTLARTLRCSTQPIFSYYTHMDDLKTEVFLMANRYHSEYFNNVQTDENIFINVGTAYVDFALEEPNLFRLLFMSDTLSGKKISAFVEDDCNEHIRSGIPQWLDKESDEVGRMFTDMWLYAHGIASMLVANQIHIEKNEIESMIKNMFTLLASGHKGGN